MEKIRLRANNDRDVFCENNCCCIAKIVVPNKKWASRIVKAVNSHNELLESLKKLLNYVTPEFDGLYPYPLNNIVEESEQAINNAEEK